MFSLGCGIGNQDNNQGSRRNARTVMNGEYPKNDRYSKHLTYPRAYYIMRQYLAVFFFENNKMLHKYIAVYFS